jgi:hypothetical protein
LSKLGQDVADSKAMLLKHPGSLLFAGSTMAEANKDFVKAFLPFLADNMDWSEKE